MTDDRAVEELVVLRARLKDILGLHPMSSDHDIAMAVRAQREAHAAIISLSPTAHNELSRQIAVAQICPTCRHLPVVLVHRSSVEVRDWHQPGCVRGRESRPALSVVPGGEPA